MVATMMDGISKVSLVQFIPKKRHYLDGITNKDELVNLDFLNDTDANDEPLITEQFNPTVNILKLCQFLKTHLDLT